MNMYHWGIWTSPQY